MSGHALLSPSGASRWLACTPSARLEEKYASTTNDAADEGTLAHKLVEIMLLFAKGNIKKPAYKKEIAEIQQHRLYDAAMLEHAENYTSFVTERWNAAQVRTPDARLYLEEKYDLSKYAPESFGTGDAAIVADHVLEIIDLKYGKGVHVDAENNPQMKLYALGALEAFGLLYDIEVVRMTIYQPRLGNIVTWEITVPTLQLWATEYLMPRAKLAYAGEGEFYAGKHCRFCKIRGVCRANADYNMEIAKYDFKDGWHLTNAEISNILDRADDHVKWLNAVQAFALAEAVNNNQHFPGYKIVEGRSNRKITDESAAVATMIANGYKEAEIFKPRALLGITELEKMKGKKVFTEVVGPFLSKPPGSPTLVVESDKRPAFNSAANAANDFEDIE